MKKGFKYYAVCWAILFALFNLACFITPNELNGMTKFGGAFWAGFVFINLAFIGQLVCAYFAFKADNAQKFFYNVPLITISYTGLALSLIAGGLCMIIPNVPNFLGIIVCAAILALNAIAVVKAKAAGDIVADIDEKVKAKTFFIKSITADAEVLMNEAKADDIKAEAKKIYEALRYSDPMSNAALVETEEEIEQKFNLFSSAVKDNDSENAKQIATELSSLIDRRNKKCKLLK
jgi:hypothetical protein